MDREYLLDEDRIYTTGCFLVYKNGCFKFDGLAGGTEHFDGHNVYLDGVNRPYLERENTQSEDKMIKCLNCGREITDEEILTDKLGKYVICKHCRSSTDI